MVFLWVFLPSVIVINYILGRIPSGDEAATIRRKNYFLLLASLLFYAWGGVYYLFIMLSVIVITYIAGICLDKGGRPVLITAVSIELAILIFFKYGNMLAEMFKADNWTEIALPIGISFFTFQAMSYLFDVYRGTVRPAKNIFELALYISLFPQLIAGPIVRYKDIADSLENRTESLDLFLEGQKRFCYGLAKKVLIANTLGEIVDRIWDCDIGTIGIKAAWLGAFAYTLQIYYDFSGYSDMAIGIGKMFGFNFRENFDHPYVSTSIREFWRRWHRSLSGWFKEYVYIPLGGNRKGLARTCINLLIVFMLTGIWHGAGYTFMLWGLGYGLLLVAERLFLGKLLDKNPLKAVNYLYTMFIVIMGWVLFRAPDIGSAMQYYGQMFGAGTKKLDIVGILSVRSILALAAGIIFMLPVRRAFALMTSGKKIATAANCIQYVLLILSILNLVSGTYNPFIYFRF